MYIRTDDDNNIIEVIVVGGVPEKNGYQIDTIDESILSDVFSYKYIDGEFVKKEQDIRLDKIDDIKNVKINMMSSICQNVIESGIDVLDKHYSLSAYDQINLMKLESLARMNPEGLFPYHADGELCTLYSAEAIIVLAERATAWKLYWSTYFNHLKAEIMEMTNVDDIISVKFGQTLNDTSIQSINLILGGVTFTIDPISDQFDYNTLFNKIDVKELLSIDEQIKEKIMSDVPQQDIIDENIDETINETPEEVVTDDEESNEVSE